MKFKHITLASLLGLSVANAASVVIPNYDFENPALDDKGVTTADPAGWVKAGTGTTGTFNPDNDWYLDANIVDTNGTNGEIGTMAGDSAIFIFRTNGASFTHTSSEVVAVGTVYTLTVAVGHRDHPTYSTTNNSYGGYNIQLLDGDSILETISSSAVISAGTFSDVTLTYTGTAADSGNLRIRLAANINDGTKYVDFDNVRLDAAPVPEPSSSALLGLGGLALILRRKK